MLHLFCVCSSFIVNMLFLREKKRCYPSRGKLKCRCVVCVFLLLCAVVVAYLLLFILLYLLCSLLFLRVLEDLAGKAVA